MPWPPSGSSRWIAKHARRADVQPRSPRRIASPVKPKRRASQARADAERLTREKDAQAAAALAEAERVKAENDARTAAGVVDADRLKRGKRARATAAKNEADRLKLEGDSRIAAAGAEADRLKRENDAQRAAAQAALDSAASQKAQLETEKVELRVLLLQQFNAILQTRDTARGLIVNMSDVLFDTGKFTLRPAGAREAGQGGRHRLRASGPKAGCRRPHRQRRRR